jgi:CRP/FNR family cyclic AMP-dependent transcriptional regulator
MATNKEIVTRLQQVPLFSRCTKSDLKIVARHVETMTVPSGRTIVRAGDDGDALFVVLDGSATVKRHGRQVAELGDGDYFGELALLDPAPRAATVTATSETELAVLGVRMFRVLLRELPPLGAKLLADLASRVRDAGAPAMS